MNVGLWSSCNEFIVCEPLDVIMDKCWFAGNIRHHTSCICVS